MSLLAVHLLQSTAFALAVALVVTVARGASPRLRYALLLTALARFAVPPIEVSWPVPAVAEPFLPVMYREAVSAVVPAADSPAFDWTLAAAALWAIGAVLSLALWTLQSRRYLRSLEPLAPHAVDSPFPVYLSPSASSPLACGIFRRRIIMPAALVSRLSAEQTQAVLVHESIHLRHHDNLVATLCLMVRTVYWFHPLVWWLDREALATREFARDEEVLSEVDPVLYAGVLLAVCQSGLDAPASYPAAMQSRTLQKRIEFLMESKVTPASSAARRAWVALSVAAALASAVILYPQAAPAQQRQSRASGAPAPSGDKWLTDEVGHIISGAERMRYEGLRSDEERAKFREQFWLVRDPTPGTPENEVKTEHYRRLAYVAQRFSTPASPGIRTPRGRFYMTMGPPDEIEDHPERKLQMWRYRELQGVTLHFDMNQ